MARRLAWLVTLGLLAAALVRRYRRAAARFAGAEWAPATGAASVAEPEPAAAEEEDPAAALRRRIDAARGIVSESDDERATAEDVAERRRAVHDRARAAVEELRRPETP